MPKKVPTQYFVIATLLVLGGYVVAADLGDAPKLPSALCNASFLGLPMPADKLAYLQAVCANMAKEAQIPPGPRVEPQPPPHGSTTPGGRIYGVTVFNEASPIANVYWSYAYLFTSTFTCEPSGKQVAVFAGSLANHQGQGVVVVANNGGGLPRPIATYLTPDKDGPVTIVSANGHPGNCMDDGLVKNCPPPVPTTGDILTLKATDGATYTFNVETKSLTRQ